jgi:hypothetical protein
MPFYNNRPLILLSLLAAVLPAANPVSAQSSTARHVVLVTLDGLRWQELFRGIDAQLAADERFNPAGSSLVDAFSAQDGRSSAERLFPFLHEVVFRQGSVLGNRDAGSCAQVTNSWYFSYPGYSEILSGVADPAIDSNTAIPNPNVTVLEWLNSQPGYAGKVAAFASWDVFPAIINTARSGVPVNVGPLASPQTVFEQALTQLHHDIPQVWSTVRHDAFTHHYALSHLAQAKPRVLYVAYGETDDFAHDGRYDQVLNAAQRTDRFLSELWNAVQADPDYHDNTVLLITTDHGRGEAPLETWQHHASKQSLDGYMQALAQYEDGIVDSDAVWIAALGPGVAAGGHKTTASCVGANQIAATLLQLLGEDWQAFNPAAGTPITELLAQP